MASVLPFHKPPGRGRLAVVGMEAEPVSCEAIIQTQRDELAALYRQVRLQRRMLATQDETIRLLTEENRALRG
jgi:hypothetical protein